MLENPFSKMVSRPSRGLSRWRPCRQTASSRGHRFAVTYTFSYASKQHKKSSPNRHRAPGPGILQLCHSSPRWALDSITGKQVLIRGGTALCYRTGKTDRPSGNTQRVGCAACLCLALNREVNLLLQKSSSEKPDFRHTHVPQVVLIQ